MVEGACEVDTVSSALLLPEENAMHTIPQWPQIELHSGLTKIFHNIEFIFLLIIFISKVE
jgi:hypothetical protein